MLVFITFTDHYRTPILIGYAIYVLIFSVRFASAEDGDPFRRLPSHFLVISLITLVLLRLPMIFVNAPFNPDEAQYLAAAMKVRESMNSGLSSDLVSSVFPLGPLAVYQLMWPFLFGFDTGFAVAHMTALALLAATWIFLLQALGAAPKHVRSYLGGAMILFLGGTRQADFLESGSEILSCLALMIAIATAFLGLRQRLQYTRLCISGVCLGVVPFIKIQATVFALTVGMVLVGLTIWRQRSWRATTLLVASACLPAALLLIPLAVAGRMSEFWIYYIGFAVDYVKGGFGTVGSNDTLTAHIYALKGMLTPRLINKFLKLLAATSAIVFVVALWRSDSPPWRLSRKNILRSDVVDCVLGGLLLAAGVQVAAQPGRPFPHYAFFIVWPAAVFAGALWSFERPRRELMKSLHTRPSIILGGLLTLGMAVLATAEGQINQIKFDSVLALVDPRSTFHASELLPNVGASRGRLLVWGWMPQFYVWSGLSPASRDQANYGQILPTPLQAYFRDRMMSEIRANPPEYIVDAVAKGSFQFDDPETEGIASFPELASLLSTDYVPLSSVPAGNACPRLYANRAVMARIARQYVKPVRVSASPASETAENVTDGVVFETCPDAWLLPPGQTGKITLDIGDARAISEIQILNTHGGQDINRQTTKARVTAYISGAVVLDQAVDVPPWPRWTKVAVPDRIAAVDKIAVAVESFTGIGGGLNEIRLRRR